MVARAELSKDRKDKVAEPPRSAEKNKKSGESGYIDHWWHARVWLSFSFGGWWRLMRENRFAVSPHRIAAAILITFVSVVHSFLRLLQWVIFGRRIARTEIADGPLFIIGHWRSGTTLLHELLAQDPRHAYPTNYQCFAPHHFLLSEWLCKRLFFFLLPSQRPMDNMAVGWDRPQEDEFALCALGEPSSYWTMAFPDRVQYQEYLDFRGVPAADVARWKRTLLRFVQLLTYKYRGKRIILKSPTHTGRVNVLRALFPKARFIHIVRDPFVLYRSSVHLWKKMYETQHLRTPHFAGLEDYVFDTLNQMYAAFAAARPHLAEDRYYEVRYEDLVRDPVGQIRRIYQQLHLGDFATAEPGVRRYLAEVGDYRPNRYEIPPDLKAQIQSRWAGYIEQHGYAE